jgi:broad specificity phosphatase PhoE
MVSSLPKLYIARHGDTAWTDAHRHTGRVDLPLNERGEEHARQLGRGLAPIPFVRVFTSPLRRVTRTCALAGFGAVAKIDRDLLEWDYGPYEGKTTREIVQERPGWEQFRDGCPGGESAQDVADRADRFIARVHELAGDVLAFSSGHVIRMIAARWLGLPPAAARCFFCEPGSVGVLGFEHDSRDQPILQLWNSETFLSTTASAPMDLAENANEASPARQLC